MGNDVVGGERGHVRRRRAEGVDVGDDGLHVAELAQRVVETLAADRGAAGRVDRDNDADNVVVLLQPVDELHQRPVRHDGPGDRKSRDVLWPEVGEPIGCNGCGRDHNEDREATPDGEPAGHPPPVDEGINVERHTHHLRAERAVLAQLAPGREARSPQFRWAASRSGRARRRRGRASRR